MRILRKLLDFYLDASIHVALAVLSLFWVTVYFLNLPPNFYLAALVFFGSIVFYNLAKDSVGIYTLNRGSKRYYRSIRFLSMAALLAVGFFFVQLTPALRWRVLLVAVLAALYMLPLPGRPGGMRNWGWLKILWVGFSWSAVTVFLPVSDVSMAEPSEWIVLAIQRVLMVTCLLIPFEIRDARSDPEHMRTIPRQLGVTPTRWLGYALLGLYFVLIFLRGRFSMAELLFDLAFCVLMAMGIRGAQLRQTRYYAALWIEGIPILLWLGLLGWVE